MSKIPFKIEYNEEMGRLTKLLTSVKRAGSFMTSGALTVPLPRVDVDGVGTLAFPLLDTQAQQLANVADAAPFGRGEETLYDASVRRTQQVGPDRVAISGAQWAETLRALLTQVKVGLGCEDLDVSADFYKLLLYRTGDFFGPHRDTEKAPGMFATLVITLPSFHEGGTLLLRHGNHENSVNMAPRDVSEIHYAAFYADVHHEVLPVVSGNRLCLVYNLIHTSAAKKPAARPEAPVYDSEVKKIAVELKRWKEDQVDAVKAAWLLDHAYTPAGLSFQGLKHVDAARAQVLLRAAEQAACDVYLGLVHIEESGPAEIAYRDYGRRSRYDRYRDAEDVEDNNFEVVEISDRRHWISDWITPSGASIDFGELPLLPGELLPAQALDGEPPDEQRVTEATGNEGASFERSYHRAALVVWDRKRTAEVLLHAGTAAAVAYLAERVSPSSLQTESERAQILAAAQGIVASWETGTTYSWRSRNRDSGIGTMLNILHRLADAEIVRTFVETVVAESFESGINEPLASCLMLLDAKTLTRVAGLVMQRNAKACTADCIDLLVRLSGIVGSVRVREGIAQDLIANMPRESRIGSSGYWPLREESRPRDLTGTHLADLFDTLRAIKVEGLTNSALAVVKQHPDVYAPDGLVMDALRRLQSRLRRGASGDAAFTGLWQTAATLLLDRSATPPLEPTDWTLPVKAGCRCELCQALLSFAVDPHQQTFRFPLRQDRRQHLHQRIVRDGMDMTHETERRGSPHTLVCTKTRRTYQTRLTQYQQDIDAMRFLAKHVPTTLALHEAQLEKAIALAQRAC